MDTRNEANRAAPAPIGVDELERMLLDPDVPDEAIRPYLRLDETQSSAFRPAVQVDPDMVEQAREESALALSSLNGVSRWRRQQRYRRKVGGWQGLRIVSEGDSWFQYPFLLEDVIDHLFDEFAILSLDAAGDLLGDMVRQDELSAAITAEKPQIVLLSGGGNDLLGDGRLRRYLHPFDPSRSPEDYLKANFDRLLAEVIDLYRQVFRRAAAEGVERVVCHAYDWAVPKGGRWLGRPMATLGIADAALQERIVRVIVDRFHDALAALVEEEALRGRAVLADCRGAVGRAEWHDELHPDDAGFGRAARRIRAAILGERDEAAVALGDRGQAPLKADAAPQNAALGEAAAALAEHSEEALYAEVGRRAGLLAVDPLAAGAFSMTVASSSAEGAFPGMAALGRRIVGRQHRELHALMCGEGAEDGAERDRLRQAFGLGDAAVTAAIATALTAGLGVAPLLAPVVAAILIERALQPTWEEACAAWGEALGKEAA